MLKMIQTSAAASWQTMYLSQSGSSFWLPVQGHVPVTELTKLCFSSSQFLYVIGFALLSAAFSVYHVANQEI